MIKKKLRSGIVNVVQGNGVKCLPLKLWRVPLVTSSIAIDSFLRVLPYLQHLLFAK